MRGFITLAFLVLFVSATALNSNDAIRQLIDEKAKLTKSSLNGQDSHPVLKAHGGGVTDGQETLATNFVDQAIQTYGSDLYNNALYIQQKVEDSFAGRWNVEIFGGDPSWGRATYIKNDQWIILFGYGSAGWDYIIWAPDC